MGSLEVLENLVVHDGKCWAPKQGPLWSSSSLLNLLPKLKANTIILTASHVQLRFLGHFAVHTLCSLSFSLARRKQCLERSAAGPSLVQARVQFGAPVCSCCFPERWPLAVG